MATSGSRQFYLVERDNVVWVEGDVDSASAERLLRALHRLRGAYGSVVVDLAGVSAMDSAGYGALLRACRESRHSGSHLVLRSPSPHIRRMLEVTGLLGYFGVEEEPRSLAASAPA